MVIDVTPLYTNRGNFRREMNGVRRTVQGHFAASPRNCGLNFAILRERGEFKHEAREEDGRHIAFSTPSRIHFIRGYCSCLIRCQLFAKTDPTSTEASVLFQGEIFAYILYLTAQTVLPTHRNTSTHTRISDMPFNAFQKEINSIYRDLTVEDATKRISSMKSELRASADKLKEQYALAENRQKGSLASRLKIVEQKAALLNKHPQAPRGKRRPEVLPGGPSRSAPGPEGASDDPTGL
ncbi:hypothetical protein FA13DRAFT_1718709, partial [Coprinellus micaceus]